MLKHPLLPKLLMLLAFALAGPAVAQAQKKESVALHPCVITGGKRRAPTAELEAVCALEVGRTNVDLVPSNIVREHLEKQARGSCARARNRNVCLGHLAASTGANRALYLTVNPYGNTTQVSGLVLDPQGKVVEQKQLELPRIRNQPPRETVRNAISQLLSQLALTSVPIASLTDPLPALTEEPPKKEEPAPVAEAPKPEPTPEPTPAPPMPAPAAPGPSWKKPVGIIGIAAGAAALGLGTVFLAQSNQRNADINALYQDGTAPRLTDENVQQLSSLRQQADSRRTLALVSGGAGLVLGGAGAVLWLTSRSDSGEAPKAGDTSLSPAPGGLGMRVVLP